MQFPVSLSSAVFVVSLVVGISCWFLLVCDHQLQMQQIKEKDSVRTEFPDTNNNKCQPKATCSICLKPAQSIPPDPQESTNPYPNLRKTSLRVFSILNILLFTGCTALEVSVMSTYGLGVWTSFFYMLNGFLGYSASYRPTKSLLISIVVFSGLAIIISIVASTLTAVAHGPLRCFVTGDRWSTWKTCKHLQFSLESLNIIALPNNCAILILVSQCLYYSFPSTYEVTKTLPVSKRSTQLSNQPLIV